MALLKSQEHAINGKRVGERELVPVTHSYNTLFVEPGQGQRSFRPSVFFVSLVLHVGTVALVVLGFLSIPQFRPLRKGDAFMMREVELNRPDLPDQRSSKNDQYYPDAKSKAADASNAMKEQAAPASQHQFEALPVARHTLIQPDVPLNKLVMKDAPMPAVLLWSTPVAKVKVLAPPIQHPSNTALIRPSITRPTDQIEPSDIAMTATPFTTMAPMPPPSASSPVKVQGPSPTPRVPETSSLASTLPASAAVLSVSDTKVTNGVIALAPLNQTAAGTKDGGMVDGHTGNSPVNGQGNADSKGRDTTGSEARASNGKGAGSKPGEQASAQGGTPSAAAGASGAGQGAGGAHIALPPNGQYNVVVVGSSLKEQYPEIQDVWGGRLVYTVYLHVGLSRSWILQYTLPAEAEATHSGSSNRLEAPWPYSIVRPAVIPAEVNADSLMIHGYVDQGGKFESLGFAFSPGSFDLTYVLKALQQWQFRPAKLNGQVARVEVLVIVPLEQD